jgi:Leu/Phe-tRNA-protein transferase
MFMALHMYAHVPNHQSKQAFKDLIALLQRQGYEALLVQLSLRHFLDFS